jgi:hypothetical protein
MVLDPCPLTHGPNQNSKQFTKEIETGFTLMALHRICARPLVKGRKKLF